MDISVVPAGSSVDTLVRELTRDMQRATRKSGAEVAKVGKKAMLADIKSRRGSLRFGGGKLNIKTKVDASPTVCEIRFQGFSVGAFTILESGAKAHDIYPKKGRKGAHDRPPALFFAGLYSNNAWHPGVHGRRIWTSAGEALDKALGDAIEKLFDKAVA